MFIQSVVSFGGSKRAGASSAERPGGALLLAEQHHQAKRPPSFAPSYSTEITLSGNSPQVLSLGNAAAVAGSLELGLSENRRQ